ncbi:PREDICTED: TRAF3-interacting protein 1 [Wasmannia auropunctata]|uniref:TRAF3-interacting protein 1 n=1 Tax=Wasmannia auropunctata TaxID=64793 RepID=UPI0005EF04E3|nr:PREDICTED: TRAF3-interacting protein 1 [Wasmannia auropunctata]
MTDEVRPEVIKKTQDLLGKYFKKPPLTEKLLRKPPFRFLHDIITAIVRETGFLEGLFSEEELNSDNIKDKEAKLAFLTKLIDVVKLISGANLTVRASKIVSGQEPTKTNELLQAIGKALDKKVSSREAIEHYKKSLEKKTKAGSKSRSTTKEETSKNAASRQTSQTRKSSEKDKISAERKKRSSSTGKVAGEAKRDKDDRTEESKARKGNDRKENSKNIEVIDIPPAEPVQNKVPTSAQRRRPSSSAKVKEDATILPDTNDLSKEEKVQHRSATSKGRRSAQVNGSQEKTESMPLQTNNEEQKRPGTSSYVKETKENGVEDNARQQSVERSDQPMSEPGGSQAETAEMTGLEQSNARPKTSLRPPSARPISARPAAPRMRAKAEIIVNEEIQTPLGNISVIVENSGLKDDDDDDDAEDMVVMEAKGSGGDLLENGDIKIDNQLMQEHGHLVAQILETQRELVNTDNVDVLPKKVDIAWESGSKRDRETVAKEIDKLRGTIQTLTRTTNPLGKLLDYVQEDVEMMQKELLDWRKQYRQLNEQLEAEQKETQEMIEPMKETLKEIDSNMKVELDKICQVKAQIMKNDQKIRRLLNGNL